LPQGSGNYATGIWTQSTSLISSTLAGQIASRQVLRYASYVLDSESGLYYCSARYYDSVTRQFTTADSAKADCEESAYQYCEGDPLERADASGLDSGTVSCKTKQFCADNQGDTWTAYFSATVYYNQDANNSNKWDFQFVAFGVNNIGPDDVALDATVDSGIWTKHGSHSRTRIAHMGATTVSGASAVDAKGNVSEDNQWNFSSYPEGWKKSFTGKKPPKKGPWSASWVRFTFKPDGGALKYLITKYI
jgi:RHS repeat-associated protein